MAGGAFPTLIALIAMFGGGIYTGMSLWEQSLLSALALTSTILLGVVLTLQVSKLLSETILHGMPSSFTLELPPYRRPQVGKVIIRSLLDRTIFVLGRAAAVAAPAGLIIWLLANIHIGPVSILTHCTGFLDPIAQVFGMDGVILMAFILGFPANEIVVPIILMAYTAQGSLMQLDSLAAMQEVFALHGWTSVTIVCTLLFMLVHFPCSTTCWTIYKETGSWKWTLYAMVIPLALGLTLCLITATAMRLFGMG